MAHRIFDVDDLRAQIALAENSYIDGRWVPSASGDMLDVEDPATGRVIARTPVGHPADVDRAVTAARRALVSWRAAAPSERGRLIRRLAELVEENLDEIASLDCLDAGMPPGESHDFGVPIAVEVLRYFAGWADKITGSTVSPSFPQSLGGGPFHAYTRKEPVGVVAIVTPWNIPLWAMIQKLAPALAAGCTVVAKPAELTPLAAARLVSLVDEAGFPPGVVNLVQGLGSTVGAALTAHPRIAKIAFTGSVPTGQGIVRAAADTLKRVSLELGGKSPVIVFDDADLDKAIASVVANAFVGAGQNCIASTRVYAQRGIYEKIVAGVVDGARGLRLGRYTDDPDDGGPQMGPVISAPQRERVLGYIDLARREGGTVETGGRAWGERGFFIEPTVITGLPSGSRVDREEVFGPVVTVAPFDTEEDASKSASHTDFGLGYGIWTSDLSRAHRMAAAAESGQVWVNCFGEAGPGLPFGGVKKSGWGRETSRSTLEEYTETKTVVVDLG